MSGSSYSAPRPPPALADASPAGIPSMTPSLFAPLSLRPSAAIFMPAVCNPSASAGSNADVAGIPLPVLTPADSSAQLPSTSATEVSVA